ncbi:hypothetical protein EDB89DRAFT_1391421 [Lactarius sanguifluus]|nr:hypothetical protein EDB89DRAFT_1391421 [Lactarius sanguifluus]
MERDGYAPNLLSTNTSCLFSKPAPAPRQLAIAPVVSCASSTGRPRRRPCAMCRCSVLHPAVPGRGLFRDGGRNVTCGGGHCKPRKRRKHQLRRRHRVFVPWVARRRLRRTGRCPDQRVSWTGMDIRSIGVTDFVMRHVRRTWMLLSAGSA